MAYRFMIEGIEIQCDTVAELKQAMAEAGESAQKAPSRANTPASGVDANNAVIQNPQPTVPKKKSSRKYPPYIERTPNGQGKGPSASWAEAAARAEATGETTFQARLALAAEKRAAVAQALGKPQ